MTHGLIADMHLGPFKLALPSMFPISRYQEYGTTPERYTAFGLDPFFNLSFVPVRNLSPRSRFLFLNSENCRGQTNVLGYIDLCHLRKGSLPLVPARTTGNIILGLKIQSLCVRRCDGKYVVKALSLLHYVKKYEGLCTRR